MYYQGQRVINYLGLYCGRQMKNHIVQSSELESSNTKFRLFEQQYVMHSRASTVLLSVFQSIIAIEKERCTQFQRLLPSLDSIQSQCYKGLASKIATYLDTVNFQIQHMVSHFEENIVQYSKLKSMVESRFTQLMRQFKRKRSTTADSLHAICQTVVKNNSQPSRQSIHQYNQALGQYNRSNEELMGFRKEYQGRMMAEASDQMMKFFVIELEKLRNNQFDIDQILKKPDSSMSQFKLAEVNEHPLWEFIEAGPFEHRVSTQYGMKELNDIVRSLWKQKIPLTNEIFSLFSEKQFDSTLAKLPQLLQDNAYRQLLIPTFLTFHQQRLLIRDEVFKEIYQMVKITVEYSLSVREWDLLETSLVLGSAICTQRIISFDKNLELCEIVCLLDYLKMLKCLQEPAMTQLYERVSQLEEAVKDKEIDRCRKVCKRLGIVLSNQKGKKKIFNKYGSDIRTTTG